MTEFLIHLVKVNWVLTLNIVVNVPSSGRFKNAVASTYAGVIYSVFCNLKIFFNVILHLSTEKL